MARLFTWWKVSVAACVVSTSLAAAQAQQPTLAPSVADELTPVIDEQADANEPAEIEADEPSYEADGDDSYDYDAEAEAETEDGKLKSSTAGVAGPKAEVELITERYPDGRVKIEREVTQDSFGNYILHGSWKMFDQVGNVIAKGQYVDNQRSGVWHRWHRRNDSKMLSTFPYNQFQEPFISEATFDAGQIDGKWTIYDAKQRKVSEWEFVDGQRHGLSAWYLTNAHRFREMPYRNGALHGHVQEWNGAGPDPSLREEYQEGRKIAPKTTFFKNTKAKQTEGMYLFAKIVPKTGDDWWNALPAEFQQVGVDERHGPWISWYPNGQKQMTGEYRNDVEVGRFTWWYPNGQKATEGDYKIGKPNGEWTWWHQNGQKSTQGAYSLGNPAGRWSGWDETGHLSRAEDHTDPHVRTKTDSGDRSAELPNLELNQPRPIFK